jgi:hypothetical protein
VEIARFLPLHMLDISNKLFTIEDEDQKISNIKFFKFFKKKSVLKYQKIAQKFQDIFVKKR